MDEPSEHYEYLVTKLIFQHCHPDSRERRAVVKRYITNGLDYDQAGEVIDTASDDLGFVMTNGPHVWYEQTEEMILYVKQETSHDLGIIADEFDHLTPPSLRDKYNIPAPRH